MSNVTECIDLYVNDEDVTDDMFRRFILAAAALDELEHQKRVAHWAAMREARRELQELRREGA